MSRALQIQFYALVTLVLLALGFLITHNLSWFFVGAAGVSIFSISLLTAFFPVYRLIPVLAFLLPFSVNMEIGGGSKLSLPAEPLIGVLTIVWGIYILIQKGATRAFLKHPISILVILLLVLQYTAVATSSMPIVSLKSVVVNTAYVIVFYFLLGTPIPNRAQLYQKVLLSYATGIALVVVYGIYNIAGLGFVRYAAAVAVQPFYDNHAIYSACLAMLLPAVAIFAWKGRWFNFAVHKRLVFAGLFLLFLVGIFFSYSRATWLSILVALVLGIFVWVGGKFKHLLLIFGLLLAIGAYFNQDLYLILRQNKNTSSTGHATLEEQTKSITNITSDESNAERLNRWNSAWRMFEEKPWLGFGPGTYQFQYIPFQRPSEMTKISVSSAYNHRLGVGGGAHSEYLTLLSEVGVFGGLGFILLLMLILQQGVSLFHRMINNTIRWLVFAITLGLVTYFVHGLFNNFLNTDKAAFLFWGLMSMLVTLDIGSREPKQLNHESS